MRLLNLGRLETWERSKTKKLHNSDTSEKESFSLDYQAELDFHYVTPFGVNNTTF